MENILNQILSERGLQPRPHQVRNILDYTTPDKPHVAAIATAGGKTIMTAAKFELYYSCGLIKKDEKVLILPADKTILRGNFVKQFDAFKPKKFTYCAVEDRLDLQVAIENGVQVIIGLPQLIKDHTKLLKNVKWLVVDEAHKWYFADTIRNIIKNVKPKHQFLLTGTPFKFNLHKGNYIIDYTSVKTLYSQGSIGDVNMQVLHTSLALSRMDWVSMTDNLRADKRISKKDLDKSFTEVIEELVKKLKLPLKKLSTTHNISNNAMSVFGKLQKTIIFTHGINEANVISKYLETCGVNCITSHSKVDGEIAEESFNSFRDDKDIKVLVSVNRGKEGFDFPELYNIIDMTYSQNFEVVMQMVGRLLRPSKDETFKVFYKVAPRNTSGYFTDWMDCMIQLFDDYWYSKFNGRNTLDIRVPNALLNRPKQPKEPVYIQDGKKKIEIASGSSLGKGTKIQVVGTDNKKEPLKDGTYKIPQPPTNDNPKPTPIEIVVKKGVITKTTAPSTRGRMTPKNLQRMGFDNSLSFMEKNDWFRLEDPLSTVATTTLRKVMTNFDGRVMIEPLVYSDEIKKEHIKTILSTDENGKRKYNIISDLQKTKPEGLRIYNFFEKFGLINELQVYLPTQRKQKGYWTIKENILAEALKVDENGERVYKEVNDLLNVHVSAVKNARKLGILYTECKFPFIDQALRLDRSVKIHWTKETALEKAKEYKNITEVYRNDSTLMVYLKDNDLVDLAFKDGRKSKFSYTKEDIIKFTNKHKIEKLKEFNEKFDTSFNTIKNNLPEIKIWDDIKYKKK
jgi:superfamily II DNA or RNA helicase